MDTDPTAQRPAVLLPRDGPPQDVEKLLRGPAVDARGALHRQEPTEEPPIEDADLPAVEGDHALPGQADLHRVQGQILHQAHELHRTPGQVFHHPAGQSGVGPHGAVMAILLGAYRPVVAAESIKAMTVRLIAWSVVLALLGLQLRLTGPGWSAKKHSTGSERAPQARTIWK